MRKKITSIIVIATLLFGQSSIASAITRDDLEGGFTALADLSGVTPVATLNVTIANVDGSAGTPTELVWSGVNLGDDWKISDQYFILNYQANQVGWGIQIWTDNMGASANPKYAGDPTKNPIQQPGGLIGARNRYLTCPMTILVLNDSAVNVSNIRVPHEVHSGTPGTPGYAVYFDSGYKGLVVNPDMEEGSTAPLGWTTYRNDLTNETGWVTEYYHSSNHSLKIVNTTSSDAGWVGSEIFLTEHYPTTLTFSGWAKAQNVSSSATYFCLDFMVEFTDGTYVWHFVNFTKGTHGWEYVRSTRDFGKPIKKIRPYCLLYGGTGTAWFDDVYVSASSVTGVTKAWFWLKDKSGTRWVDKNGNGVIDLTGSFGGADYELVSDFSTTGDDYATIVNAFGSSTGWVDVTSGKMHRDDAPTAGSRVNVYVAAKFVNAKEIQQYKTNSLYLELYHE